MADADWHMYRQLRGKELPSTAQLLGTHYDRERVLKRDFYATVGIYLRRTRQSTLPQRVLLKIYHTDSLWRIPLAWLGRWLCRREMRFYQILDGIEGIPRLLGTHGEAGLVREYIPGCNLREFEAAAKPDPRFFIELAEILGRAHARGMSHNDLSKPENILVTDSGRPVIIDYQIALAPRSQRWPLVGVLSRTFVRFMQQFDRYHIHKLHTRSRPEDFTEADRDPTRHKPFVLKIHGVLLRRPYRAVRHAVMRRWMLIDKSKKAA